MKRVAIYARYSSDKQSETSADDQARLCIEHAERAGWHVAAIFKDEAVSGSIRHRPELTKMLARAAEFDVVLAESIDRLSRDQEDIAGIHKRLRFAGVEIVTLADGEVGEIHIGLKGTMAALYLRDLAQKTKRGQIGRVEAGRIPGGLSYGYRKVVQLDAKGNAEGGLREIDEAQAEVIRRIFRLYLANVSPREIAKRLNAEGVPSPRGGLWRANAIFGNRQRRNGILNNDLYVGRIVYNRQSFRKDPDTRRRVARPNPPEMWKVQDVPALRIIDEATWSATQARLERAAQVPPHRQRRPKRLFSGLLRCGVCGGTITIICKDQWGCSNHKETGTCTNNRLTTNKAVEKRVLGALRDNLLAPDAIAAYVAEYRRSSSEFLAQQQSNKLAVQKLLGEADQKVKRLAAAIANGADVEEIRDMLHEASAERDALRAELADIEAARVIPLHPHVAEAYRTGIAELSAALEGTSERVAEAKAALRGMVEQVVVHPRSDRPGVDLELHGRLAQIINFATNKKAPAKKAGADGSFVENYPLKLVAGARSSLNRVLCIARV